MVHKSYSFYYSGHNVMLETIYYIETEYIIIIMHYMYYAFNTYTRALGAAAVFFQYEPLRGVIYAH